VGSLKLLLLGQNKLTSIDGDSVAHLTNLEELTLECNQLSHLPFCLGALTKLTLLWAGQNRITGVPTSLGRLVNLRSLRLEQNLISFVPVDW
jgi:Leucine-rich repeat (LRR) protein